MEFGAINISLLTERFQLTIQQRIGLAGLFAQGLELGTIFHQVLVNFTTV